jgi:hypothetical protein
MLLSLVFTHNYCSSTGGSITPNYSLRLARPLIGKTETNTTNVLSPHDYSSIKSFPGKPSNFKIEATDRSNKPNGKYLHDDKGIKLNIDVNYGNFQIEYRLYTNDENEKLVAKVSPSWTSDDLVNNDVSTMKILSIEEDNINSDVDYQYNLKEYYVLNTNYLGSLLIYEYDATPTGNVTQVTLGNSKANWSVLERAPRDLKDENASESLKFPTGGDPISLLKTNILKHGPSPQQLVYEGSFEEVGCTGRISSNDSIEEKQTKCNSAPTCIFDPNIQTCKGKTLIKILQEQGDLLTTTDKFDPSLFMDKDENSHYTNLTFLKSLQITKLNYKKYTNDNIDNVNGGNPTEYFKKPNPFYYSDNGYDNLGFSGTSEVEPELKLGRFIPYMSFYPSYINSSGNEQSAAFYNVTGKQGGSQNQILTSGVKFSDVRGQKDGMIGTNVDTFYNNLNYTQFIPYGKKSYYEYGFVKDSDIPTF